MNELIDKISGYFNLSAEDLTSKSRLRKVSTARNFAYYVLHVELGYSTGRIAKHFGRTRREVFRRIADIRTQLKFVKSMRETYDELVLIVK